MKYEDALVDCLDAIDGGRDLEAALLAHPEHAERLRADVSLVRELRDVPERLTPPEGAAPRAQARLQRELATLRQPATGGRSGRGALRWLGTSSMLGRTLAGAAIVLVLAVGLSIAGGGPGSIVRSIGGSPSTAEAAFDGVVVENADGVLMLQTPDGLSTVSVANGASITDENGAAVALTALQPGRVVDVKGKKLTNGTLSALVIRQRALSAVEDWCATHAGQCPDLKDRLQAQLTACEQKQIACPALQESVTNLRARAADLTNRLNDLLGHCQKDRAACQELRSFCKDHTDLCKGVVQRLLRNVPSPALRDELRDLLKRCNADRTQCAALTTFCQQNNDLCRSLTDRRP